MIASTQQENNTAVSQTEAPDSLLFLPSIKSLAQVTGWANAPMVGVLLLMGNLKLALSVASGSFISFLLCSFLGMMVARLLGAFVSEYKGASAIASPNAMMKFVGLGFAKFVLIGLVMLGIVSLHANLYGVLIGFAMTQIAIVVYSARIKKR